MKKDVSVKTKEKKVATQSKTDAVSKECKIATVSLCPIATNANTLINFSNGLFGKPNLSESVSALREKVDQLKADNLSNIEETLAAQAITLNSIFNEMALRAAANMGNNIQLTETYLRMALKAQAQSRSTMETLAEVKFPKSPTFVKQQNNAYQQQINNEYPSVNNHATPNMPIDVNHAHEKNNFQKRTIGIENG
jgi:hypothetical protein